MANASKGLLSVWRQAEAAGTLNSSPCVCATGKAAAGVHEGRCSLLRKSLFLSVRLALSLRYYSCSIRIAYKILQIIGYNENASRAFDYMIINGLILKIISVRYKMFFQVRLYWYHSIAVFLLSAVSHHVSVVSCVPLRAESKFSTAVRYSPIIISDTTFRYM